MRTIFYHTDVYQETDVHPETKITSYYTQRRLSYEEYKKEFGKKLALKKNQKLITVRDYLSAEQVSKLISEGARLAYKN